MQIRWHNGRRRDTKQTKASRVVGKRQARDDVREIKIYKFFFREMTLFLSVSFVIFCVMTKINYTWNIHKIFPSFGDVM